MTPIRRIRREEGEDRISRIAGRLDRREPPAQLWSKIETRLKAELETSGSRVPGANRGTVGINRFWRPFHLADGRWSWIRISLATVAVILAAVLTIPGLRRPAVSLMKGASSGELAGIEREAARAEREYRKAIERLTALAGKTEKDIKPGLLALYRERIDLIDTSIRECRAALEANYRNPSAHAALLYCYKQKAETLRLMAGEKQS